MNSKIVTGVLVVVLTASAFAGGLYAGKLKTPGELPVSARQLATAGELFDQFEDLPKLKGTFDADLDGGAGGYHRPTRKQFEEWLVAAVWKAYDQGHAEGVVEGKSLQPEVAGKLGALVARAQRVYDDFLVKEGSSNSAAARVVTDYVTQEWKDQFGDTIALSPAVFQRDGEEPLRNRVPVQPSANELNTAATLKAVLETSQNQRTKLKGEVLLVNRQ